MLIIPANVLLYQFELLNACIGISASRCRYHAEDGDAIVSTLWLWNGCDAIVARLLFDATELDSFWCL